MGGAVYNEDWSVSQFLSADKIDLPRLRSSKYLQSRFDGFYITVREALKTGKPVLVVEAHVRWQPYAASCTNLMIT